MNDESTADLGPGDVLRYVGQAIPGLTGSIVKVIGPLLDDDGQPTGTFEIQPWVPAHGRYSWVTSAATADELAPAPDAPAAALDRDDPTTLVMTIERDAPGYRRIFGDDDESQ